MDDEYLEDLESRIRDCVARHCDLIRGLTAEESDTRATFSSSLLEKVAEADGITSYEAASFFKLASIDVAMTAVLDILSSTITNKDVSPFFEKILNGNAIHTLLVPNGVDDPKAEDLGFVTKTHVTLAHCRETSQSKLRLTFKPLVGAEVDLVASGLLWNERVMALAVTVPERTNDGQILPVSKNEFVHVTVWIHETASAVESNNLPTLVSANQAQRLDFESPVALQGIVALWTM